MKIHVFFYIFNTLHLYRGYEHYLSLSSFRLKFPSLENAKDIGKNHSNMLLFFRAVVVSYSLELQNNLKGSNEVDKPQRQG